MSYLFFIIALLIFAAGLYFLIDWLIWRLGTEITMGEIIGFSEKTDKGFHLPKVRFELGHEQEIEAEVLKVDRLLYMLNQPAEGAYITLSYKRENPDQARVHGYVPCILAAILLIPLLGAGAYMLGSALLAMKTTYVFILMAILLGGWAGLKFIQRNG